MVVDHTGVNKSAKDLVAKLKVTPKPNATSESLQKNGDDNLAALNARQVTVVLDACFSGATGGGEMLITAASPIARL